MSENNATMSAGMPASAPAFGSDVKRLPLKDLLKRIGPGLIATGIVIGPGAVTTASMIGANYGYDLMWLFFPIIFMGITFMMVSITARWLPASWAAPCSFPACSSRWATSPAPVPV